MSLISLLPFFTFLSLLKLLPHSPLRFYYLHIQSHPTQCNWLVCGYGELFGKESKASYLFIASASQLAKATSITFIFIYLFTSAGLCYMRLKLASQLTDSTKASF